MKKVLVLLSGGMDSTTLLHHHVKGGDEVRAITFNYGQRHGKELSFAFDQAIALDVPITVVDLHTLGSILPSSLTNRSMTVPEGKYTDPAMKSTIVPNRNMILLAIAIGHAIAHEMDAVSYGAQAGGGSQYYDARPEFAEAMAAVAKLCDERKIDLLRPLVHMTKADVVRHGRELGVDYTRTWTCYVGADLHCGRCGACIKRREAFHVLSVPDPTEYAPSAPSIEEMLRHAWHLP